MNKIALESEDFCSQNENIVASVINWFKTAKPNPCVKDIYTQISCHFEEIAEMLSAMDIAIPELITLAIAYRNNRLGINDRKITIDDNALLDSLCDQIITAIGIAYMLGFDIEGALAEVNRSNWSKFENGKALFFDNGKIAKGKNYFKPDLTNFINK